MAEWLRRLPSNQKIAGSSLARGHFLYRGVVACGLVVLAGSEIVRSNLSLSEQESTALVRQESSILKIADSSPTWHGDPPGRG